MKHELDLLEALTVEYFEVSLKFENGNAVLVVEDDDQIIEVSGIENFDALGQAFASLMKAKAEEEYK